MPQKNSGWISNPSNKSATVVFVHGVLGKRHKSWRTKDVFWPEMLSQEPSFAQIGVYVFSYHTNFFSAEYGTPQVAESLMETLKREGIWESRALIFVCHSHGGTVVRRFLVGYRQDLAAVRRRIGLVLIACPSDGSAYANLFSSLATFFNQAQIKALRQAVDNVWLKDVGILFASFKDSPDNFVRGKELIETKGPFPGLPVIVEYASAARYFPGPKEIEDTNHSTIASPSGPGAEQHLLLKTFIGDFLAEQDPRVIRQGYSQSLPRKPSVLVELKNILPNVRQKLMANDGHAGRIVALSGGAGSGKSTVATCLVNDPAVMDHYGKAIVWIRLRQEGANKRDSDELRKSLAELASNVGLNERDMEDASGSNEKSNAKRAAWIRFRLVGKKLLLVTDDVWTTIQGDLLNVVDASCGASMLLMSRSRDVARELTIDDNAVDLPPLTNDEATELLSHYSPYFVSHYPKECADLIRAVKCLPIALSLLGSLLRKGEPHREFSALLLSLGSLGALLSVEVPRQMAFHENHENESVQELLNLSTQMMSADTRVRYFKLGVFPSAGTFDARSLAFVWEDSEDSARTYIWKLIDWSIISVEGQVDRPRYSVHALLLAYARSMLSDIKTLERRHDQYYLELAQSLGPDIRGREYQRALSRLQEERDNIELALSRADLTGDVMTAVAAATSLVDFWYATGTCGQGFSILKRLTNYAYFGERAGTSDARADMNSLVRALCGCAYLAFFTDDSLKADAKTYWRQAVEISPANLDAPTLAISLIGRLNIVEDYEDNVYLETVSQLVRTIADVDNPVVVGDAWTAIGWSQYYAQAYDQSIQSLSKAATASRSVGDNLGLIECLNGVVLSATEVGEYGTGDAAYREGLLALDQLGAEGLGGGLHHNYGWLALAKGDVTTAKKAFRHSQDINAGFPDVEGMVGGGFVFEASACIASAEGRYARAAKLFGAAAGRRARTDDLLPEWMEEQYRPWIAEVSNALTPEKFEGLFASGQKLSDKEAGEYEMGNQD